MEIAELLDDLLELVESKGVEIRKDSLGGSGGGYCLVRGKGIFYFDTDSGNYEAARQCAKAIEQLMDLDQVYLRPQVRSFIEENI